MQNCEYIHLIYIYIYIYICIYICIYLHIHTHARTFLNMYECMFVCKPLREDTIQKHVVHARWKIEFNVVQDLSSGGCGLKGLGPGVFRASNVFRALGQRSF